MADLVFSQYVLLRQILSNLPVSTLVQCARVNRLFSRAVKATLNDKSRNNRPAIFTWVGEDDVDYASYEDCGFFDTPAHESLFSELKKFMRETHVYPACALIIFTASPFQDYFLYELFRWKDDAEKMSKMRKKYNWFNLEAELLADLLPRKINVISWAVKDAYTMRGWPESPEIELRQNPDPDPAINCPSVSIVFFPRRDDAKIVPITDLAHQLDPQPLTADDLGGELKERKAWAESVRGCLFLPGRVNFATLQNFDPKVKQKLEVVESGGACGLLTRLFRPYRKAFKIKRETRHSCGLFLSGPGVKVFSLNLRKTHQFENVRQRLIEVKKEVEPENALALFFDPCSFNATKCNDPVLVTFREIFPTLPLIGCMSVIARVVGTYSEPEELWKADSFNLFIITYL